MPLPTASLDTGVLSLASCLLGCLVEAAREAVAPCRCQAFSEAADSSTSHNAGCMLAGRLAQESWSAAFPAFRVQPLRLQPLCRQPTLASC